MSDDNLTVEERQMLEKAAEGGGHFSIRGLLPAEMTHAADVALALHRLGLMNEPFIQKTFEKGTSIIEQITVGLTDEGREYLAEC